MRKPQFEDAQVMQIALQQPPPHHPRSMQAVELTNPYPGDPQHIYHWAMVTFWLHRAHRRRIPMILMCHQHMRQFAGHACTRFTESILRQALSEFCGDLHVNTMFGIGKYWREVLSPQTARVRVATDQERVVVSNGSDLELENLPVDVTLSGNGCLTLLLDVPGAGGREQRCRCVGTLQQPAKGRPVSRSPMRSRG